MKHYGDITKLSGYDLPIVDIVTGGSPCQDLSCAGKRKGLQHSALGDEETTRSGLFMEQIRVIKEMREHDRSIRGTDVPVGLIRPRYMVWENVAGALSSGMPKGGDFRIVLEETAKIADKDAVIPGSPGGKWPYAGCIVSDGWSIAWRLHDSQWFGVPQRRKRICLLADFNGDTAGKVLFELQRETTNRDTEQAIVDIGAESRSEVQSVSEGVSGDIAQGGKEGERVAEDTERCANPSSYTLKIRGGVERDSAGKKAGKGPLVQTELSATLGVSQDQTLIAFEPGAASRVGGHTYEDVAGTVRANAGDNQQAVVYGIGSYDSNAMKSDNPHSGIYEADTSRTLDLNGGNPGCNQGGMAVVQGADVYNGELTEEKAATLTAISGASAGHSGPTVVQGFDAYNQASTGDVAMSLRNKAADSDHIPVVCIEGNGQRESHKGDGYKESDTMYTLNTVEQHAVCIENHPADSRVKIAEDGICQTLSGRMETGGGNVPMVVSEPTCLTRRFSSANVYEDGITPTLEAGAGEGGNNMPMVMEPISIGHDIRSAKFTDDGVTDPLTATDYKDPIKINDCRRTYQDIAGTLDCGITKGTGNQLANSNMFIANTSVVRRLTPMECERLQGFPDDWTNIGDWVDSKGKTHKGESDSPRYKALGNSIALPFWQWMAERMMPYLPENPTMASLFDGIGGFPLVFSRCGCKPVWASEIEEFPIAVTKRRFPDESDS